MGDKIVKSRNLCCQPVVFPSLSLLRKYGMYIFSLNENLNIKEMKILWADLEWKEKPHILRSINIYVLLCNTCMYVLVISHMWIWFRWFFPSLQKTRKLRTWQVFSNFNNQFLLSGNSILKSGRGTLENYFGTLFLAKLDRMFLKSSEALS